MTTYGSKRLQMSTNGSICRPLAFNGSLLLLLALFGSFGHNLTQLNLAQICKNAVHGEQSVCDIKVYTVERSLHMLKGGQIT
jgi:hypothetical protein